MRTLAALLAVILTPCPAIAAETAEVPPKTEAAWREAAHHRIDQYRKAGLEVRVRDAQGKPIADAAVTVAMKRHAFGFGALIGRSRWQDKPNAADARRHLALTAERFNKVVTILDPDDRSSAVALNWLAERGIRVRGHYLMWAPLQPGRSRLGQPPEAFALPVADLKEKATAEQRAAIRQAAFLHLERVITMAGDRVHEWDVINHLANDAHVRYSDLFGPEIFVDVIKRARELAPHAQLWVNEGNVLTAGNRLEKYEATIRQLIALGGKPDGIGFMAHFREGELTSPAEIYRRLDRFAALVPNLQLTELDIDVSDEQLQASYMRDVLTTAFSHPAVSGIVMWQVWGQGAGRKTLWRADFTEKPVGGVWLDQVFRQWWTHTEGTTTRDGTFQARGFLGHYEITVRSGEKVKIIPKDLTREGSAIEVVL